MENGESQKDEILKKFNDVLKDQAKEELALLARNLEIDELGLRWTIWQRYLGVFDKPEKLANLRKDYEAKRLKMREVYEEIDEEADANPLMQETEEVRYFWLG